MPSIEGGSIVDEDLLTVVAVNEADPSLRNKKFQFDELVVYLDQYFQNTSGNTFSGDIIVGGNATISGLTTTSGLTVTHTATVSGLTVQDDAIVSGTISGGIVSGNTSSFNQSEIQIGTIVTLTGTTFTYSTGVVTSFFSGAVITGDTINALNFATSNFTAAYISGGTVTGISGEFGTLTAQSVTLSGVTVTDALTVSGALGVSGLLTASGAYITGTITGNTITGNSIYGTSGIFTYVSGTTITGDLISVTSGVYAHVSGATITGNNISGAGGQFAHLSGATITGDAVSATVVTGVSGVFTNISGTSGVFTNITGTNIQANRMDVETGVFQDLTAVNMTFQGDQTISGNFTVIENQVISGNLRVVENITGESNLIIEQTGFIENIVSSGIISGSTINGNLVQADSGVYTYLSGATITGDLISGTSGVYTYVSGTSITGDTIQATSGIFVTGSFTDLEISGLVSGTSGVYTYLSGATITGDLISGTSGVFTNLSGSTITGDTIQATSGIFVTGSFTDLEISGLILSTGLFASGTESAPSITFVDDTDTGFYNAAANEVGISTGGAERLRVDNTGNVGIGTTTPATRLHVKDTVSTTTVLESSASQSLVNFRNSSTELFYMGTTNNNWNVQTSGVQRLSVTTSGNVGIGTSNPAGLLHVSSGGTTRVFVEGQDGRNEIRANNGNLSFFANGDNNASGVGNTIFYRNGSNESMRIDPDGNLGIGTSAPDTLLHLSSATGSSSPTPTELRIATTTNAQDWSQSDPWSRLSFYNNDNTAPSQKIHASIDAVCRFASGYNSNLIFNLKNDSGVLSPVVAMLANGNVGIGTTDPQAKLDVAGTTTITASSTTALFIKDNEVDSSGLKLYSDSAGVSKIDGGYGTLALLTGNTEAMRIDSNGNVGIGTTSPQHLLSVVSSLSTAQTVASFGTPSASAGLQVTTDGNLTWGFNAANSRNITFSTNQIERLRIDSSGNVGIGTTIPAEKLQVNGGILFATANRIYSGSSDRGNIQISSPNEATNRSVSYGNNYYINTSSNWVQAATNIGGSALELRANNANYGEILFRQKQDPDAGGAERIPLVINTLGNVGIGTSAPVNLLHVQGDATFEQNAGGQFAIRGSTNTTNRFNLGFDTTSNYAWLQAITSGTSYRPIALNPAGGNVGIGTTDPQAKLEVNGGSSSGIIRASATGYTGLDIQKFVANADALINLQDNGNLRFQTNSTERVRIDSSGNLLVKISSARTNYRFNSTSISPLFQLESTGGNTSFGIIRNNNSGNAGTIYLAKSRGTTNGSNTIVQQGDRLGSLSFNGAEGTNLVTAARIDAEVDGTPGTNDMPGRLLFSTTADGASNPTERLRITSTGNVGIGTSSPASITGYKLIHIQGDTGIALGGGAIQLSSTTTGDFGQLFNFNSALFAGGSEATFLGTGDASTGNFLVGYYIESVGLHIWYDPTDGVTERMRMDSGGKVGIGTSSPVEKLDVNGTVKCKNVRENVFTITWSSSFVLKPVNGGTQFVVLGGNSTPTQSGWTNGESITLHIDDGASRTINWTTLGVVWTGGTAPTLATTGDTVVQLWKAGNVIYGALVGEVA